MIRRRRLLGPAALLAAALVVAGCNGGAFLADQRLDITGPAAMTIVTAPFDVTWTSSTGAASYAVFVDRAPMPPGHTVRDLATDSCKHTPGCPDASYLAGYGVYLTTSDSALIPTLSSLGGTNGKATHPTHTATVVGLDHAGRRVGDVSWTVEFRA